MVTSDLFFVAFLHYAVSCAKLTELIKLLFMDALCSRCGHYILVLFLSSFFVPSLISVVADWMSTILLHMVWS